ncbi:MAG: hypothetical protein A3J79_12230 [Elusimicrobia bacterium RIFOXYB2_FULL_62_6]|nr:MAG: hypothetical protein A3J79_12230 [Elusimicrobia bacterium RIFOXYB2_FULL_62_6]
MRPITQKAGNRRLQGGRRAALRALLAAFGAALCLAPAASFAAFEFPDAGARQSGLGDACAALGGDANSLLHNPAGLAYLDRDEVSSSYNKLFTGLDDGSNISAFQLLYGRPLTAPGGFGLGWMETRLSSLYQERTLSLGYGHAVNDKLAFGAALKQLRIAVQAPQLNYSDSGSVTGTADAVFADGESASGLGMDLGVLYEPADGYSFGLSLQNVNQPEVSLSGTGKVPALVRLGAARRTQSLLLAYEFRTREFIRGARDYEAVFAAEKWWRPGRNASFALRSSFAAGSRDSRQFTLGLGYRVNGLQADYSFLMPLTGLTLENTYGTHRVSLTARFGRAAVRAVSWEIGNAPYGVEMAKMQRRAAQAEKKTKQLQDEVEKLETEIERQKKQTPAAPAAAPAVQGAAPLPAGITEGAEKAATPPSAGTFKAKPEFDKISPNPEKAQEFFREGMRQYSRRLLEKAAQSFRKSLELDPANDWTRKSLERTLTELKQERTQREPAPAPEGIRYTARSGDTMRSLAETFFGDAGKWTLIRDANPKLKDPQKLPAGAVVIIPQIPEIPVPVPEDAP